VPTFEYNAEQTRASRKAIDAFLKKTGSQLWIQHDFVGNSKLKKSPQFYEYTGLKHADPDFGMRLQAGILL
jgi:hypothetical protein